jgi:dynein heavy chain
MEQARAAVDGLSAKSIGEFKGMTTPPTGCEKVTQAVQILRGEYKKHDWDSAKIMMKDPNKFKESLEKYDKDNIPDKALDALKDILALDFFNEEAMKKKSSAAANMCKWVVAIVDYNRIYRNVKPLQDAAEEAAGIAKQKSEEL